MSAISARRAAALKAAQASASAPSAAAPTPSTGEAKLSSRSASSDGDVNSSPSSSQPPLAPSAKRRKTRQSPAPKVWANVQARYFASASSLAPAAQVQTPLKAKAKIQGSRERKFSPSAPAEVKLTSVADNDVDSSATGSDDVLSEDEGYEEAGDDVDEGRIQWTAPSTSVESTPGPSRIRNRVNGITAVPENSSTFVPREGVNIHTVQEKEVRSAGIQDKYPGSGVVLSLGHDESLLIAGTYIITPLSGRLEVASTALVPDGSSFPIFAPTSHPIPPISASVQQSPTKSSYSNSSFADLDKLRLPKGFNRARVLFLIRENKCGIDGLRYGAVPGFANIWLEEQGLWGLRGVHPVIGSFSTPVYPHITHSTWSAALAALPSSALTPSPELPDLDGGDEDLQKPFIGLVKGTKRSGKSTFARTVLNNLLEKYKRVAWLECDLGQGEFGCGGVVGLWVLDTQVIGPSFTHPLVPHRAHYLGTYTPLTCPDEYVASIQHLIEYYKYELQYPTFPSTSTSDNYKNSDTIPLVVNTQGWVKGLGEELLRSIEGMAEPTHVYSFESVEEESYHGPGWTTSPTWQSAQLPIDDSYPYPAEGSSNAAPIKRFKLEPAPVSPLQARYTAADLRVLSTISYFHATLSPFGPRWDFTAPLLAQPPWEVEYGNGKPIERVYLIGEGSEGIVESDLPLALNGNIVALLEYTEQPVEEVDQDQQGLYVQGRLPPSHEIVSCLGLALIRAVVPSASTSSSKSGGLEGKIQLLTPLPAAVLGRCKAVVKNGAIELPNPGMMDWRSPLTKEGMMGIEKGWDQVPFFDVSGVEVVGGERRRFRKNIMRKGM
ncbi:hypothetical protein I317_00089 [Kwoniella heveanensis CBS 569]|nr:hypothetical protein I317_00089 [Kwoniella heveanensis CBS 569]